MITTKTLGEIIQSAFEILNIFFMFIIYLVGIGGGIIYALKNLNFSPQAVSLIIMCFFFCPVFYFAAKLFDNKHEKFQEKYGEKK